MDVLIGLVIAHPWLAIGIVAGLVLRTVWPWLLEKPRPPWDWKALIAAVLGGAGAIYATMPVLQFREWWLALLAGTLAGVGAQTLVRLILKPGMAAYRK